MTNRSDLVLAVHQAQDGQALARAVAALDNHDQMRREAAAASQELDLGVQIVAERLTSAPLHEHHTAATDWLAEPDAAPRLDVRTAMVTEAAVWYQNLGQAVREDTEEFGEQARGRARTAASAYGYYAGDAERHFLQTVAWLHTGASGLPQIDQTIDPNNNPAPTPYPAEVFPTFGEEQDAFNGVETNAHGSGAASTGAPMLQQLQQMDGSGSGFGSGPEKQLTHDTGFGTQDSYAEVPLGTPGTIPTSPAATDRQAGSAPTPMMGDDNEDEGSEHRQVAASVQGYSAPDPFGYRWGMSTEVMHPFHERCGSAHWPDERCGDRSHTASVAIGYSTDLDTARRHAACEIVGVQEGIRAIANAGNLAGLGEHHNRLANAWNASGRTDDDTAVLHGFMAVVRPVLAELAVEDSGSHHEAKKKHQPGGLADGGVSKSERADAKHHLPGTDKFPVNSAADVENAKHDIGRTNEPKKKVVDYVDSMAKEYGVAPVGGDRTKKDHAKAASREN